MPFLHGRIAHYYVPVLHVLIFDARAHSLKQTPQVAFDGTELRVPGDEAGRPPRLLTGLLEVGKESIPPAFELQFLLIVIMITMMMLMLMTIVLIDDCDEWCGDDAGGATTIFERPSDEFQLLCC